MVYNLLADEQECSDSLFQRHKRVVSNIGRKIRRVNRESVSHWFNDLGDRFEMGFQVFLIVFVHDLDHGDVKGDVSQSIADLFKVHLGFSY